MQNVKVIIGASYGDEGKGLATDFFGAQEKRDVINVLTNGGPQRGHTVELADGRRHVFRHFGAASFRRAATYYAEQFLINPMEFVREYDELAKTDRRPEAFMHPACRFTTPWDILVNQAAQSLRGINNSCGYGIWETVLRYMRGYGAAFSAFAAMDRDDRISYLRRLRDGYFVKRLAELGAGTPEFFLSDDLLFHFEEDCETMRILCPVRGEDYFGSFKTVLFENAQGLLLDGNIRGQEEVTTPSTTGIGRVFHTIERVFSGAEVEVCYVTRSYLTRHGDGIMENELKGEDIKRLLPGVRADLTNVENRYQGALRYGLADAGLLAERIGADFARCSYACGNSRVGGAGNTGSAGAAGSAGIAGGAGTTSGTGNAGAAGSAGIAGAVSTTSGTGNAGTAGRSKNTYRPSVMVTHMNEYSGIDTGLLADRFGTVYLSDGRTGGDVHVRQIPQGSASAPRSKPA